MLWLWLGAIFVVDWVGRGVVLADLSVPESTATKVFQWLISTPWYVPATLATALTAVAIYLLLHERATHPAGTTTQTFWRRKKNDSYGFVASGTAGDAPNFDWLKLIAIKDDQQIQQRIHVQNTTAANQSYLDAPNPYIDLEIGFINASVFELLPVRIEGRLQYLNHDLEVPPELFKKLAIGHGQ